MMSAMCALNTLMGECSRIQVVLLSFPNRLTEGKLHDFLLNF